MPYYQWFSFTFGKYLDHAISINNLAENLILIIMADRIPTTVLTTLHFCIICGLMHLL